MNTWLRRTGFCARICQPRLRLTDPQRRATTFTNNLTILGGTGTFSGAARFATAIGMTIASSGNPAPGYFGTVATSGSGPITASGLTAVPEPTTYALFGLA